MWRASLMVLFLAVFVGSWEILKARKSEATIRSTKLETRVDTDVVPQTQVLGVKASVIRPVVRLDPTVTQNPTQTLVTQVPVTTATPIPTGVPVVGTILKIYPEGTQQVTVVEPGKMPVAGVDGQIIPEGSIVTTSPDTRA